LDQEYHDARTSLPAVFLHHEWPNLETELITDTRNLDMFRQGKVSMRCAFCGLHHYWRLVRYQRPITPLKRYAHRAAFAVRQP
jgi:hypothetical protein